MYYGLYMSAAGANAQSSKVEVLSNNLANVNTVGFKRELALLEARQSEAIERGAARRGTGEIEDIDRARRVPSAQLIGTPQRHTLDLNLLSDLGVR